MNQCKLTEFGLSVRTELLRSGRSQKWLIGEVGAKTGMFIDGSYLNKILTGQRKAAKLTKAIKEILSLEVS